PWCWTWPGWRCSPSGAARSACCGTWRASSRTRWAWRSTTSSSSSRCWSGTSGRASKPSPLARRASARVAFGTEDAPLPLLDLERGTAMTPTCDTIRPTSEDLPQPTQEAGVAPPDLDTVLHDVRRDCIVQPLRYLDEVVVPFGGE